MKQKGLKHRIGRRFRNSQRGQSIILLALGFVALAAFVGLVTDISIMFVRYATLRRAVDSAAVAAAGQIREGTNYGVMAVAARQYISMHGLEPHAVWVETCETEIMEWRAMTEATYVDAGGNTVTVPRDNSITAKPDIPDNPATPLVDETRNAIIWMEEDPWYQAQKFKLCSSSDPRKLVRVVAQIQSQTTFLKLVDIEDFIITASAVSETAALDVALILDTSGSMGVETTDVDYTHAAGGDRGVGMVEPGTLATNTPPLIGNASNIVPSACINSTYLPTAYDVNSYMTDPPLTHTVAPLPIFSNTVNWGWGYCCNDPGNGRIFQDTDGRWKIYTDLNGNDEYDTGEPLGIQNNTKDGRYDDLICWPFKQVKDAARNFIQRLDFVRGDRVGIVGFDRIARIYKPVSPGLPNMMASEAIAVNTLNQSVGIYTNLAGVNSGCYPNQIAIQGVISRTVSADPTQRNPDNTLAEYMPNRLRPFAYESMTQCSGTNIGGGIKTGSDLLTAAETIRRDSVWVAILLTDGASNASLDLSPSKAFEAGNTSDVIYYGDLGFCPWYTFCYFRGADHPIMGGADRTRPYSEPLIYSPSDYPAVYSDPAIYGTATIPNAMWYDVKNPTNDPDLAVFAPHVNGVHGSEENRIDVVETFAQNPNHYNYSWSIIPWAMIPGLDAGSLPVGFPNAPSTFTGDFPTYQECIDSIGKITNDGTDLNPPEFTYNNPFESNPNELVACNDNNPETRHFCWNWAIIDVTGQFTDGDAGMMDCDDQNIQDGTSRYDADDYARDMADFAGLAVLDEANRVPGNFIAMFAIGFGEELRAMKTLPNGSQQADGTAMALLHYIADAGDNGVIDNNDEADWRDDYLKNNSIPGTDIQDPCAYVTNPVQQCGQYYYANTLAELEVVFEDIASRLFSRISR